MHLTSTQSHLVSLLKQSVVYCESSASVGVLNTVHLDRRRWLYLLTLAKRQGVAALVFGALPREEKCQELKLDFDQGDVEKPKLIESLKFTSHNISTIKPPNDIFSIWENKTKETQMWYEQEKNVLLELLDLLSKGGFNTLLVDGVIYGSYYPNPSLREYGDIDIYLYDSYEKGIKYIKKNGIDVMRINNCFSKLNYRGVCIRIHKKAVLCISRHIKLKKAYRILAKELSQLVVRGTSEMIIEGITVKIPQIDFQLLSLLKSCMSKFLNNQLYLKSVCDLAVFINKNRERIDFGYIEKTVKRTGCLKLYNALLSITNRYFGTNVPVKEQLKFSDRVFSDILTNSPKRHHYTGIKWLNPVLVYFSAIKQTILSKWKLDSVHPLLFYKELVRSFFTSGAS